MGHTLHSTLAVSIQLTSWHPDIHLASLPRHEAICLVIASRDPQAALEATRALLKESRNDFDSRKKTSKAKRKSVKAKPKSKSKAKTVKKKK